MFIFATVIHSVLKNEHKQETIGYETKKNEKSRKREQITHYDLMSSPYSCCTGNHTHTKIAGFVFANSFLSGIRTV